MNQLAGWLVGAAAARLSLEDLFVGFCARLVAAGLPVWRVTLGLETLHPEESGTMLTWIEGSLRRHEAARAGILESESYRRSPVRIVDETDEPFRCRLWQEGGRGMPLLERLIESGATDYAMLPLPFLDTSRTATLSFATRAPGGFDDAVLQRLSAAAALFSPYAERVVLRRIANDLLAAYLGPGAGRRVWDGQIERGDVQTIAAAIWFCDLRGFTAMAEHLPRREVIELLNRWFDALGGAIEAHGGEILKFMGDGLLAVFPVSGEPGPTCTAALHAAAEAVGAVEALNRELADEGRAPLGFGLALHLGEVEFGNIGTRRRLDFTVIGPAVNHASRLQELTKEVGETVVASAAFAAATGLRLRRIGRFGLRGIAGEGEVYAP